MTKEEAIEELKEINFNSIHEKTIMATNIAIKALEQQQCTDAISRSEAIRIASGYCHWTNIPAELAKLPSVTPAQNVCEDAVSRELVKKDIARWIGYIDEDMIARMHITIDKLPSVTPKHCEDVISRQAVFDCLTATKLKKFDFILQTREEIKNLPSVSTEKTGRWIPVSERFPKDHENVLIYLSSNQITIGSYNSHRLPFMDKPIGWGADAPHDWSSDDVTAWMPLPQPYKAESEDKE